MALITKTKTWVDAENVAYTDLNANFDTAYAEINGNIDNANVKAAAAIAESKISFNTSTGHDHDGIDSKAIPKGFVWTLDGDMTVQADPAPWITITATQTITKVYASCKTAPTGASLLVDIEKSTDNGANWVSIWNVNTENRLAITTGNRTGTQTSFDVTALAEGNMLRIAVDQVGSTIAGANLTVTLKA